MASWRRNAVIRLLLGPYSIRREAEDALARVKALGQEAFVRKFVEGPDVKRRPPSAVEKITPAPPPPPALPPPVAEPNKETPLRLEQLRAEPPPPPQFEEQIRQAMAAPTPGASVTAEDLFGLGNLETAPPPGITGFYQSTLAYTWPEPAHLSNFRHLLELSTQGRWGKRVKWKLRGRLDYDAVFALDDHYPDAVKENQEIKASVRETYADLS